jgi:anti-sigma regulatory factor (Ser/Thr protein kinase)
MGHDDLHSPCAFGRTVPARAEHLAALRHSVVEVAARAGADDEVQIDLSLAFAEACANVIVHAYDRDEEGPLDVRVDVHGQELTVAVSDQGRGMIPRPDSPGLGLGLPLIANLADSLEIHDGPDGGTEVVMAFALRRERT